MNEPIPAKPFNLFSACNLKRCPVCDSLAESMISECTNCSWHGEFIRDPEKVEETMIEVMCNNAEINAVISGEEQERSARQAVRRLFGRVFRRRLDVRV